jgi:CzcA family heavy metal efflux pump
MLKSTIALSLRHPALVFLCAGVLLCAAGMLMPRMAVDVFPELNAPTVVVLSEAGGLAADEVEVQVSQPIEQALSGIPGLRRVRSSSATSLSLVWAEFAWGQDIMTCRQQVVERLGAVRDNLPAGVHSDLTPITSITGEIMLLSLSSPNKSVSPLALRGFAEYELRSHLLAVPGVAQIVAIGGELPEYQVACKQDVLRQYGLTLEDVVQAARQAHTTVSAGYLPNVAHIELPLRQTGRVRSVEDISATVVAWRNGVAITLGQVADVTLSGAPKRGTGAENGEPAVVLTVQKAPYTNTLAVTAAIDQALDGFSLPAGMQINRHVFRQADFINLSVSNVLRVLIEACIVVGVVVLLFLMNARASFITLTAIPLSLSLALLVLWAWGMTINVMTLGGLAVAIGELVDDAIIGVENVLRRLRENARALNPLPVVRVMLNASNEVRSSVVFATIIIVLVFVPLLFLDGLEGRFFQPLGVAYITAILASLVVALTVTPALCRYLFQRHFSATQETQDSRVVRLFQAWYRPWLLLALRWKKSVMGLALGLTVVSLLFASRFGSSFLPTMNELTFTVFITAPPGTSLAASDRLARGIEQRLAADPSIRSVVRRTGRAERDEHAHGVNNSEVEIAVADGFSKAHVRGVIDAVLADIPGITTMVGQPIEHRLSHMLSGTPAAIAINVFGDDLSVLRRGAQDIEQCLKKIPGVRDVVANREVMIQTAPIRYRSADLQRFGLTPAAVAEQVRDAIAGEVVAEVADGLRRYEVVVRLAENERANIDDIRRLIIRGAGGSLVRLDEVADITRENASDLIIREQGRRKAVISCNVADDANLGQVIKAVQSQVNPLVAQLGCTVSYGGQFEAQQRATTMITLMGSATALVILVLLTMAFGHWRPALLVMINLPLALIGGIVAVFFTSSNPLAFLWSVVQGPVVYAPVLSIASLVGFVTLFGIAVRNGILLVNHYAYLRRVEQLSVDDAIVQGSLQRLSPILMTALTAVFGLVPLVWAAGSPGSELLAPLAAVVLGGLVTSTVLNLIVVPAGYALTCRDPAVLGQTELTDGENVVKQTGPG